jgi:hypothetical protein
MTISGILPKTAFICRATSSGVRLKTHTGNQPPAVIPPDRFGMLVVVLYLERNIGAVKEFLNKPHFFEKIDRVKRP